MSVRARALLLSFLGLIAFALDASAIVIAGGDGTGNTTPPADDFGLGNVGQVFNGAPELFPGSGVYLGDRWVLSAYHPVRDDLGGFRFGPVVFRDPAGIDIPFAVDGASAQRLKNADGTFSDLAVFQLTTEPAFLGAVRLATSTPLGGAEVRMAGWGINRETGETHWDVNTLPDPDVWTETAGSGDRQGYKSAPGVARRWGENTMEFNLLPINRTFSVNAGFGEVTSIKTDFDSIAGEAQGAPGDSGGAVFFKNGTRWELIGITHTISTFDGQPPNTSVFENSTFAADLPTYRAQILGAIPEPSSAGLLCAGAAMLLRRRRRSSLVKYAFQQAPNVE